MFCRIDILNRDEKAVRVIATRYVTGANMDEIQEAADHACQRFNAPGYRVRDMHTERVEEVWN